MKNNIGFTIVELIVVITIVMILMGITFTGFFTQAVPVELDSAGQQLQSIISYAKQLSSSERINTLLEFDRKSNSIKLFKDLNSNELVDEADEEVKKARLDLGDKILIYKAPDFILFQKVGYSRFIFTEQDFYEDIPSLDFENYYKAPEEEIKYTDDYGDIIFKTGKKLDQYKLLMDFDPSRGITKFERLVK